MAHHLSEQAQRHILEPLSTKWIEGAAGVSRDTVAAWRRGRKPRPDQWERFTMALDAWRSGMPDTTKEPPPEWAGAMEQRIIEAVARPELWRAAERVIAQLEALGPRDDEAPPDSDGAKGPGAAGPPGREPESRHGRTRA